MRFGAGLRRTPPGYAGPVQLDWSKVLSGKGELRRFDTVVRVEG